MSARHLRATVLLLLLAVATSARAQLRDAGPGDVMEPFTLPTIDGQDYAYDPARAGVTMVAVVAAHQKRSERTIDDLAELARSFRVQRRPVGLLLVVSGGQGVEYFRAIRDGMEIETTMLVDAEDELWGRLGVVVTPTAMILDEHGTIRWVRAGHSFDFSTEARDSLEQVLGLAAAPTGADAGATTTALTAVDRAKRHLRIGQVYALKGKVDAGIEEVRKAETLLPDWPPVRLELARLLCRAGKPVEALDAIETVRPASPAEGATVKMLSGWASRQLGELERAQTLLEEAVEIDPGSSRALFELGRVLEARGECVKAAAAFRRALEIELGEAG